MPTSALRRRAAFSTMNCFTRTRRRGPLRDCSDDLEQVLVYACTFPTRCSSGRPALRSFDAGECQKIRSAGGSGFHFRGSENPISTIIPQNAAASSARTAVSHRHALKRFTRRAGFFYVEIKEIVEIDGLLTIRS